MQVSDGVHEQVDIPHGEVIPTDYYEEQPASLEETERETIRRALARNNGKRKKTAEELCISERTLYRKIKEYNLE